MRPVDPAVEAHARGRATTVKTSKPPKPRKSRRQQARAPPTGDDDCEVYDIKTFCQRHRISPSFYYQIKLEGLGPKEMRVGKRVLITRESAARWRAEREAAAAVT